MGISTKTNISQDRLKEILHYDPLTGELTWLIRHCNVAVGDIAGCIDPDCLYWKVQIDNRLYRAHRLIWLYMTGEWPVQVDHKDRNRSNNKWDNLREATRAQNAFNTAEHLNNTSGYKGVCWLKSRAKWRARIRVNGERIHLGLFDTPEAANTAYVTAANQLHGEFSGAI